MRGNESEEIAGDRRIAGAEFPIPMRGNEGRAGGGGGDAGGGQFPIPMRGNESFFSQTFSPRAAAPKKFPIPMRGNEVFGSAAHALNVRQVSDPHEG